MNEKQKQEQAEIQKSIRFGEKNCGERNIRFSRLVWFSILALAIPLLAFLLFIGLKKIDQLRVNITGSSTIDKKQVIETIESSTSVKIVDIEEIVKAIPPECEMVFSTADPGIELHYDE